MPMCRLRPPIASPEPVQVIVRMVEEAQPADLTSIEVRLKAIESMKTAADLVSGEAEQSLDLAQIETRLKAVEELDRRFPYEGTWAEDRPYGRGKFVTHGGSLWFAERATASKPGTENSGWKLAVKRGKDGRDRSGEA